MTNAQHTFQDFWGPLSSCHTSTAQVSSIHQSSPAVKMLASVTVTEAPNDRSQKRSNDFLALDSLFCCFDCTARSCTSCPTPVPASLSNPASLWPDMLALLSLYSPAFSSLGVCLWLHHSLIMKRLQRFERRFATFVFGLFPSAKAMGCYLRRCLKL